MGIVVVCVCPSVPLGRFVRTITRHGFELESPHLHQTCILEYSRLVLKVGVIVLAILTQNSTEFGLSARCILGFSRLVLKMGVIDLDLQGHFGNFDSDFWEIWLVRAINCNRCELESPNWQQICILRFSCLVLKMGVSELWPYHVSINSKKRRSASLLFTGPVFCLLLGVSSGCAQPITGQVTSVTWPVIGWA